MVDPSLGTRHDSQHNRPLAVDEAEARGRIQRTFFYVGDVGEQNERIVIPVVNRGAADTFERVELLVDLNNQPSFGIL